MDFDLIIGIIIFFLIPIVFILIVIVQSIEDTKEEKKLSKEIFEKYDFENKRYFLITFERVVENSCYDMQTQKIYKIVDFEIKPNDKLKVGNTIVSEFACEPITAWEQIYRLKLYKKIEDCLKSVSRYTEEDAKREKHEELVRTQQKYNRELELIKSREEFISKKCTADFYWVRAKVEDIIEGIFNTKKYSQWVKNNDFRLYEYINFLVFEKNNLSISQTIVVEYFFNHYFFKTDVLRCQVEKIVKNPQVLSIPEECFNSDVKYQGIEDYNDKNNNNTILDYSNYKNRCWNCGHPIDGTKNIRCKKCATFYICLKCGKCLCDKYHVRKRKIL